MHSIGKHLGTFNLFREGDGSLWITCAEARGVAEELNGSGAPLGLCAMNALYAAADAMRERARLKAQSPGEDRSAKRRDRNGLGPKGYPQRVPARMRCT